MPVYETRIDGVEKPRLIKADTPAAARNHVVTVKGVTAERMSDLMDQGVALEKAAAAPEGETGDGEVSTS